LVLRLRGGTMFPAANSCNKILLNNKFNFKAKTSNVTGYITLDEKGWGRIRSECTVFEWKHDGKNYFITVESGGWNGYYLYNNVPEKGFGATSQWARTDYWTVSNQKLVCQSGAKSFGFSLQYIASDALLCTTGNEDVIVEMIYETLPKSETPEVPSSAAIAAPKKQTEQNIFQHFVKEYKFTPECVSFWTDTVGEKLSMPSRTFSSALYKKKEIPGYEMDQILHFLESDGYVTVDGNIMFGADYYKLVGTSSDPVEAIRKMKKQYDSENFVFHQKRAILIGNKKYDPESGQKELPTAHKDVDTMLDILTNKCNFEREDIETLFDRDWDELNRVLKNTRDNWAKKLVRSDPDHPEKGLLFVYYSGHGQIANNVTNIICRDGRLFPLPLAVSCPNKNNFKEFGTGITVEPNTMAVVFMECCRLLQKGGSDDEPLKGEYYIYYAVDAGKAASTSSDQGDNSEFTKKISRVFETKLKDRKKVLVPTEVQSEFEYMDKGGIHKVDLAAKPTKKTV